MVLLSVFKGMKNTFLSAFLGLGGMEAVNVLIVGDYLEMGLKLTIGGLTAYKMYAEIIRVKKP